MSSSPHAAATPLSSHSGVRPAAKTSGKEGSELVAPEFAELVEQYSAFVWRSLRFHGVPDADLPDQSQEVFLVIHRKVESFEGRNTVRAWVYGICRRVAAGYRRKAHVQREEFHAERDPRDSSPGEPPELVQAADPSDQLQNAQTLALLEQALAELPDEARETFVLYEIEELSMKEIADMLGCPLQTAYSRLHAAREHVRKRFRTRHTPGQDPSAVATSRRESK